MVMRVEPVEAFTPLFTEIFKSGGSVIGKIIIDPHL